MADTKISALTGATTPLAGTEVLPIVQSGTTKKVSVDNLTAGKTVNAANLVLSGDAAIGTAVTTGLKLSIRGATTSTAIGCDNGVNTGFVVKFAPSLTNIGNDFSQPLGFLVNDTQQAKIEASGNLTLNTGNLVIGTSGKGIDFSATPGTGTSELLADYEEGTWTPEAGAGLTVVGAFSSSGTYTKIGRIVQVRGRLAGATSVAFNTNVVIATGLPFAASLVPYQTGTGMNDAWSASSLVNLYSTNVLSVGSMAATTSFDFTATYQV